MYYYCTVTVARRSKSANVAFQNGSTVLIWTLSSGECAPLMVGPNDTHSTPGIRSPKIPHSRPAWTAFSSGVVPVVLVMASLHNWTTVALGLGCHPGYACFCCTSAPHPSPILRIVLLTRSKAQPILLRVLHCTTHTLLVAASP